MSKQNVILIGGGDSYSDRKDFLKALQTQTMRDLPTDEPYKSWRKWLVEELGEEYRVDIPDMPNKHNAKYDEWRIWFERHLAEVKGEVILIGVSLGAMFLAKYLIENAIEQEIVALFLLAGPCGFFEDEIGNDCKSFGFDQSEIQNISQSVEKIYIMHSKDDFVVPYDHALKYKAALPKATLLTFEDKNHFLVEELPELLEKIRQISKV